MDTRRRQIIDIVKREFIGPDPIDVPGLKQDNGEEILSSDPPTIRYLAGVLYPQKVKAELASDPDSEPEEATDNDTEDGDTGEGEPQGGTGEFLQDMEELLNLSNSYHQSAISITAAVRQGDTVHVKVSAGRYAGTVVLNAETGKSSKKYYRRQIKWENNGVPLAFPDEKNRVQPLIVFDGENKTDLRFHVTYRYSRDDSTIYTFTLENSLLDLNGKNKEESCYFQAEFVLTSESGFSPLPENEKLNLNDADYLSNQLLYRNVRSYAIGHGCAASWDDEVQPVREISTSIFPEYEVKPIVPGVIDGVSLSMFNMSDLGDRDSIIPELNTLCSKYGEWIDKISAASTTVKDKGTAYRHIENCRECLTRMKDGVSLLAENEDVMLAFRLMNRAMLLQQLHYNLPIQNWVPGENDQLVLENPVEVLPDICNDDTWYGNKSRYGKWRPFQLAFVLINLRSMYDRKSRERSIVDLIWFPTGGGKTEAYLGLSAYTIFIRRLKNKDDAGTTILMRYTLRLLTSQQYERASSMICACETIRNEMPDRLGSERISIGLWVGGETSPNSMSDAVKKFRKIHNGTSDENPFVILKCPWCGAQMGIVKKGKIVETPGYEIKKEKRKESVVFKCRNKEHGCVFSYNGFELPLYVIDDDIYGNKPTLVLGTVDKFAMLPYRPEAQTLFGLDNGERKTAPDLIIQDELHLISGPLGSMVGHYETMIHELCSYNNGSGKISPKVIASTATISRAAEQCHALYGCGKNNVKQFPPSGIDAGDSFFAKEDKKAEGRRYVGILAAGSTSNATTMIRLYASLLYAAKAIKVTDESERDGYWTNIGYFNSIRELGQTETWIRADIDEYLHVIYKRRYEDKLEGYKENRRYIYVDEELTSRIRSDKIPASLQKLGLKYPSADNEKRAVDICLATNMISVGVDVPRLGLMTVAGQPKTTSEYIQATSRVGRDKSAPGLVFTVYNPGRPRDKSHYENFIPYHSRIYCNVEPTSVTPFSGPLRDRALHALVIGIMRLEGDQGVYSDPPTPPNQNTVNRIKQIISERVSAIDPDELENTLQEIDYILDKWSLEEPQKYQDFTAGDELPLMFPAGSLRNETWGETRSFPTPTSMRNVDASCEARILENGYFEEDE